MNPLDFPCAIRYARRMRRFVFIAVLAALAVYALSQSNMSGPAGYLASSGNIGFTGGKGQHIVTQSAQNDSAGTVALTAGAGTKSFTTAWTSAPVCVCSDQTAAAAVQCSATTTLLTVAGTGTDTVNYECVGNPN